MGHSEQSWRHSIYSILILVLSVALVLAFPIAVKADTSQGITVAAQGSEVSISCNQSAWSVGTVSAGESAVTGLSWAELTNNCIEDIDVTIAGRTMKDTVDGNTSWTLSNSGTPGTAIFAMKAGLEGGDYTIVIKNVGQSLNTLVTNMATGTQNFGLKFYAPTAQVGNLEMEMVGSTGSTADEDRGIVLTASASV